MLLYWFRNGFWHVIFSNLQRKAPGIYKSSHKKKPRAESSKPQAARSCMSTYYRITIVRAKRDTSSLRPCCSFCTVLPLIKRCNVGHIRISIGSMGRCHRQCTQCSSKLQSISYIALSIVTFAPMISLHMSSDGSFCDCAWISSIWVQAVRLSLYVLACRRW